MQPVRAEATFGHANAAADPVFLAAQCNCQENRAKHPLGQDSKDWWLLTFRGRHACGLVPPECTMDSLVGSLAEIFFFNKKGRTEEREKEEREGNLPFQGILNP